MSDEKRELKLLEAWEPPAAAGAPIGCLATTFTFNSVFFEEECLGRFLNLESDPKDDDAVYFVEREEKLSGVCAAVLADQHHCRGKRNVRWDLLSARPQNGVMHAKVSLLHWTGWTRVIIASANLTPEGYRKNLEIFAVLDYSNGSSAPLDCLRETIGFLRDTLDQTAMTDGNPAGARSLELLDRVSAESRKWGTTGRGRAPVRTNVIFSGPGRKSVLEQISDLWPHQQPPINAWITSPFYDTGPSNLPAKRLWERLRQRGDASLTFNVRAEKIPGEKKAIKLFAPHALKDAQPGGRAGRLETKFNAVFEYSEDAGNESGEYRPLHLKSIWLENDFVTGYLVGSSNFTTKGLGLTKGRNIEANLFFTTSNNSAYRKLESAYLDGEEIGPKADIRWTEEIDETEAGEADLLPLPTGFKTAVYRWDPENGSSLILQLGQALPDEWTIRLDQHKDDLTSSGAWKAQGAPSELIIKLTEAVPPAGLEVTWVGAKGLAWWPVVVQSGSSLPPPDELKLLSLDDLVNILSSARPLHQILRRLRRKQGGKTQGNGSQAADFHKRVDMSNYLLQRTRRLSWAFRAIREKLERPIATRDTLAWRLYGPVGVQALATAISKAAKSPDERSFLFAELALELGRIRPAEERGYLPAAEVVAEIRNLMKVLEGQAGKDSPSGIPSIQGYVRSAFREALK